MATTFVEQLAIQGTRVIVPIIIFLGTVSNILNIIILTRQCLYLHACSFYFRLMALINLFYCIFLLTNNLLADGYYLNLSTSSEFFCKFISYLLNLCPNISVYLIVLASIDRFAVSSTHPNIRRLSDIRVARWAAIAVTLILAGLLSSAFAIFSITTDGLPICTIAASQFFGHVFLIINVISYVIIAPTCMLSFGLLTIHNANKFAQQDNKHQLSKKANLEFYISHDHFVIQPIVRDAKSILVIDRTTEDIQLLNNLPNVDGAEQRSIYGIIGIIHLISGPYLIVITSKLHVGDINGQAIYKVQTTDIIPFTHHTLRLTEHQLKCNNKYLSMVEVVLRTEAFYFSYSYDITHTFQRLHTSSSSEFFSKPFIDRADQRFVWNRHLLDAFVSNKALARFTLPVIHGFVAIHKLSINKQSFTYAVISRRSTHRAGTRLFIRGIDDNGQVANYVETEQIFQLDDVSCSYVQIRGSVPCYWTQRPNLRYKPRVAVLPTENHMTAFQQHFKEQEYHYGKQFLISLTNHHGAEGKLNSKYRELYEGSENVVLKFEDFDFHKECAGMRYDRLTILLARIIADQDDYGYFAVTNDGTLQCQQTGVFRTNCVDCLDRTNVVQSLFAKRILEKQLQHYNVIKYKETIDAYKDLSHIFKNIWADNADVISLQYAGTGALKTDYTRTGQRSTMGLLQDGYNSLMRYVLNNFYDGFRQDGIDLFLGNYRVSSNEGRTPESCPVSQDISKKLLALPITMFLAFSMCIVNLLIPASTFQEQMMYVFFWGITSLVTLGITIVWGQGLMSFLSYLARLLHLTPYHDPSLIIRNVAYFSGSDAHVNHKLDIFLPSSSSSKSLLASTDEETSQKKVPIVVHIHGGGWVRGSRTNEWRGGPSVGRMCAKEGLVGVVVSYRLARVSLVSFTTWAFTLGLIVAIISLSLPSWQLFTGYLAFMTVIYVYNFLYKVRVPVNIEHMVDDLCYALIYVRDHIHEHYPQADPDQIFLSGHSAGAHLISLLILDRSHFERHNLSLASIRGVIAMSGIYTLANPIHDSKYNFRNLIFRILYSSNLLYPDGKTMVEYSPIEYIKDNDDIPPFLVMSARFDMGLEVDARRFVQQFRQYDRRVEYHIIGGLITHGTIASKFSTNDAHRHFFTFIRKHMK
ncbi:unnamed protein product [Adineta ricciae]|uniref:Phosphatidylinositol-3-phosphatase SAC1 n=1 Tax=Adineta ricciae TaxID=249248 RepID=A0A815NRJ2_ADIRI|nr:unnamed protein product [Adineta ricciae]